MARDPSNYINLSATTPVGPQTRSIPITQAISRVERLRYWRRANEYGGAVNIYASTAGVYSNNGSLYASSLTNPHT